MGERREGGGSQARQGRGRPEIKRRWCGKLVESESPLTGA